MPPRKRRQRGHIGQLPSGAYRVRVYAEQWLDVVELEATTRERYEDLIRLYVSPTFGHHPASRLDAELLERFYARLHRCRSLCTGGSSSASTPASR